MNDLLVILKEMWGVIKTSDVSGIWIFLGLYIFLWLCVVVAMIIIPLRQAGEL